MTVRTYRIEGMRCGSCARRIEAVLQKTAGIEQVSVDIRTSVAVIRFAEAPLDTQALQRAVSDAGAYVIRETPPDSQTDTARRDGMSSVGWGITGGFGALLAFYLIQALGMQSLRAPIDFATEQWYFLAPLVAGFAVQSGLFASIRRMRRIRPQTLAASGGASAGAMAACCMHNIALLVPVLGLGGLASVLSLYQPHIFITSILITCMGIAILARKRRNMLMHLSFAHLSTSSL
ncbi:heavy metal translocating P-type ATPase [Patescibacteria group bacterium]|uniref:Heavy metal translocating P-type ATPase n=1 Tax=candidate division WWE3 bacterium TaxID=2053526 RepID=A0A928Y597_UNCKA|nr:heavy metal translocating P-type ATPase [candidate division WWE3 bacterium]MCL4733084.1 heavy metal translocating P-type ATPase [Patescibacteria group bacterium]MDL1953451.1 heavy metal translocating P-type ATPase [Candidatus Uhrbacteria bacterium UHB]RIL00499.1 MAG: hypothetical protein DCC77_02965 [Candidatus Uhrbacteria bacterium]